MSTGKLSILSAICGIVGCIILVMSFVINPAPPSTDTIPQIIAFGTEHQNLIETGAWMQTFGTLLLLLFAIAIVHLAGAIARFAGWFH